LVEWPNAGVFGLEEKLHVCVKMHMICNQQQDLSRTEERYVVTLAEKSIKYFSKAESTLQVSKQIHEKLHI